MISLEEPGSKGYYSLRDESRNGREQSETGTVTDDMWVFTLTFFKNLLVSGIFLSQVEVDPMFS